MDRYHRRPLHGPQIHAVPDNEKAVDEAGKRLPWAYDSIGNSLGENERGGREPVEKGPFGRSVRRRGASRSRSKTVEPERKEDAARREQLQAEDAVFGTLGRKSGREALGEVDQNTVTQAATAPSAGMSAGELDPTEVLLYGFGEDLQWAAIDFYERASGGVVLEDYDRTAPGQRGYDEITRNYARAATPKSLSKAALRKKNRFAGGDHWIKVTFASRQAAELACARSPHIVRGHLVCAEPWQGRGPARDEPVFASQAGVQVTSDALPRSFSTNTMSLGASPNGSGTMTSGTERQTPPQQAERQVAPVPWNQPSARTPAGTMTVTTTGAQSIGPRGGQQLAFRQPRIEGARPAVLLSAEQALMPKQPKQSWGAWLGASELIGTTVPRREDGCFDHGRASLYWRLFYWLDGLLGTDFCGLKGDE